MREKKQSMTTNLRSQCVELAELERDIKKLKNAMMAGGNQEK